MSDTHKDIGYSLPPPQKANRGTRWPHDEEIPAAWVEYGHEARKKHGLKRINLKLEADKFVAHFVGNGETMKDWRLAWRKWCLRAWDGQPEAEPQVAAPTSHHEADALRRVRLSVIGPRVPTLDIDDIRLALARGAITQEQAKRLGY
jgi:hypothetical protein